MLASVSGHMIKVEGHLGSMNFTPCLGNSTEILTVSFLNVIIMGLFHELEHKGNQVSLIIWHELQVKWSWAKVI